MFKLGLESRTDLFQPFPAENFAAMDTFLRYISVLRKKHINFLGNFLLKCPRW